MTLNSAWPHCLSRSVRLGVPPSPAAILAGGFVLPALSPFRSIAGRPSPRGSAVPPARAGDAAKRSRA
jgi:hypothetical protein